MALTIEDGSLVADANSYVTTTELIAYAAARGVTIASGSAERFAILAMDYLESLRGSYRGRRVNSSQALSWPRQYVFMEGPPYCDPFPSTSIPKQLKDAQCQLCLEQANGIDLMPTQAANAAITQEVVGPISTSYNPAYATSAPGMPKVDALLELLLIRGSGGTRVMRA